MKTKNESQATQVVNVKDGDSVRLQSIQPGETIDNEIIQTDSFKARLKDGTFSQSSTKSTSSDDDAEAKKAAEEEAAKKKKAAEEAAKKSGS